eukprot:TRINITY_DN9417_c0_g1_i1.p1 TRINITY_DN9417_c0_g1~~TRINITY_DN9417_c0_g1_i1.p1  ORF type:complete len:358 (+),score=98.42 TRINITY_DN9417_c0_g1_i1:95-1075(+)
MRHTRAARPAGPRCRALQRRGAAERVHICEVGPRDGLQNQAVMVSAADKRKLVEDLYGAGLRYMEITSFVSPKAVPQMADAEEVLPVCQRFPDVRAAVLVLNEKGYDRARAAGANAFTVVAVCSDGMAKANNRKPAAETVDTAVTIARRAKQDGAFVRVALAASWVCPYDGEVDTNRVMDFGAQVMDSVAVDELSLTDVIGHAAPNKVRTLLTRAVSQWPGKVSAHFHDTQALGVANAVAALEAGVRTLDSSVGGLGGCPFAPGAAGNVATEDLVLLCDKMGFETGVDLERLWEIAIGVGGLVEKETGGRSKAWWLSSRQRRAAAA